MSTSGSGPGHNTRGKTGEDKEYAELKKMINTLSAKVDSKIDKLSTQITSVKEDVMRELDTRIKARRQELLHEIGQLSLRLDACEATVQRPRDEAVAEGDRNEVRTVIEFDPEVTIVGINVPEDKNDDGEEDLQTTVQELLDTVDRQNVTVVRSCRLRGRDGKTGIVKVQFSCKDDKIKVLRQKSKLKDSEKFRRTYIRTSKSHIERLIDINFKTILRELPGGDRYRITGGS